jgi:hypothetical protein
MRCVRRAPVLLVMTMFAVLCPTGTARPENGTDIADQLAARSERWITIEIFSVKEGADAGSANSMLRH